MTYANLLSEEGIKSQYLVVIKPRRFADTSAWQLVSGTKFEQIFSYGQIINAQHNNTVLTAATSLALSDGDWFFDETTSAFYIDIGSDPALSDIIVTYELYFGTFDAHFNRSPLLSSTRVVYYEPLITRSPTVIASNTDILFGFLPSNSTSISISNVTQYLQTHLYDSSFNRADIEVYHWLDELITANVKLITRGICGSVNSSDESVQITIYDNNDLFNAEFRHDAGESFFSVSNFPDLDPNYASRPIRKVYGVVDSFIPVNIDYNETLSNTVNRAWVCLKPYTNLASISTVVPASPSSTATRTYVTSANGIRVGDSVWIDSSLGSGFDEFVKVTVVNKTGSHYIEHATISNIAISTDVVKRNFVGSVTIFKDGISYEALYGKHYDEYLDVGNSVAGFLLKTTLEADLGISALSIFDIVHARVYGNKNNVTLSASPFGSNSLETGNLTNGVVIFYDLLKTYLGVTESDIDLTGFTTEQGLIDDELGFAIPSLSQLNFPTFKDLFSSISQSLLLKVFINDDNKFSITQTGPRAAATKTIQDDEILESSFSYSFDYRDVRSDIFIQYAPTEVSRRNSTGDVYYSLVNSTNNVAKRLHKIQKQETFTSLHFVEAQAQALCDHLAYALGERRGLISLVTKNRFYDSQINEVIEISRTKIPGFEFVNDTMRQLNAVIIATDKSLDEITIQLDDQKGIQDNLATW